jgi:hypothetical protein
MLEEIDDGLWVVEGEIVSFYGFPYPTRSVIARLANRDLWVWSPIKLEGDLCAELDRLGRVRHLISPNKIHHLYLQDWKAAYPDAQLWGPRSTIRKRLTCSLGLMNFVNLAHSVNPCAMTLLQTGDPILTWLGSQDHSSWMRSFFFIDLPGPSLSLTSLRHLATDFYATTGVGGGVQSLI